jgi:hypothetical protein
MKSYRATKRQRLGDTRIVTGCTRAAFAMWTAGSGLFVELKRGSPGSFVRFRMLACA